MRKLLKQVSKERFVLPAAALGVFCSVFASPAVAADGLIRDYGKGILDIYNPHNTRNDLPDVADRQQGRGIRQGQFWFLPEVESGVFFNTNVLATPTNKISDQAHYTKANARMKSDLGRHEFASELVVQHKEFFDRSEESHTEWYGKAQSRIDIARDLNAYLSAKGGSFKVERGSVVAPTFSRSPIEYQTFDVGGKIVKTFNRLSASGEIRYTLYDFEDTINLAGVRVDQDFRDMGRTELSGRVSYELAPGNGTKYSNGYNVFTDFRYRSQNYDGPTATNRSSDGFRFLAGASFALGRLLRGEASMGYNYIDYTNSLFGAVSSYSFVVGMVWNPTPLMTFNFDAQQRFEDSTLPGVSGSDQTYFSLNLDYEVLRRLTVSPSISFVYDNFNESSVKGYTLGAGLRAEYEINRYLNFGFDYKYTNRDFTGQTLDFSRHVTGLFLKARF